MFGYILFLLLPFVLFKILSPVNRTVALLMVIFAAVSVPISLLNLTNEFSILTLIKNAHGLNQNETVKLAQQVLFCLRTYDNGNQIASVFWGLWLFPFGYLVFKSGFLPKILGILLMFGCFGYLIDFSGDFLFPNYQHSIIPKYITKPGGFGEIGICLWLLIVGVRENKNRFNAYEQID
jgi:hypothetical protein